MRGGVALHPGQLGATAIGFEQVDGLDDAGSGLGVEPDQPFGKLDAAFREPLTVGRPIDTREPVRLPEEPVAATS